MNKCPNEIGYIGVLLSKTQIGSDIRKLPQGLGRTDRGPIGGYIILQGIYTTRCLNHVGLVLIRTKPSIY